MLGPAAYSRRAQSAEVSQHVRQHLSVLLCIQRLQFLQCELALLVSFVLPVIEHQLPGTAAFMSVLSDLAASTIFTSH